VSLRDSLNQLPNLRVRPFVVAEVSGGCYRIEVELMGWPTTVLPDTSIYKIMEQGGSCPPLWGNTWKRDVVQRVCDHLNKLVAEGRIVLNRGWWVAQ